MPGVSKTLALATLSDVTAAFFSSRARHHITSLSLSASTWDVLASESLSSITASSPAAGIVRKCKRGKLYSSRKPVVMSTLKLGGRRHYVGPNYSLDSHGGAAAQELFSEDAASSTAPMTGTDIALPLIRE